METDKQGFATYMEKELSEQPKILTQIGQTQNETLARAIQKANGAYLIGCGSAYYACLAGSYLFSKIAHHHINSCVASEFTFQEDFIHHGSLVIGLSQSGETMDLIDAVKRAKGKGATIGSIVNVEGSTLWRISDVPVACLAGPEIAVASTKDLTAKIAHLVLMSYQLAGKNSEGKSIVTLAAKETQRIVEGKMLYQPIAKKLAKASNIFIVGRGLAYPAAMEIAMKIKEISYIHAEGLAAGELKHGTIALIEKGTPCIVLAPDDETYGVNIAAAMELRARGGFIVGIASKNHEVFDDFIEVKNCKEATIIPMIAIGQLLALEITTVRGLDPDKPRNLAKSVTVK